MNLKNLSPLLLKQQQPVFLQMNLKNLSPLLLKQQQSVFLTNQKKKRSHHPNYQSNLTTGC
jgi:hypothetical protein